MAREKVDPPLAMERYRSYFRHSPDGVFVVDRDGRYLEVNEAACKLSGYDERDLLEMSVTDLVAPEDGHRGREHFQRLVDTGRSSGELRCIRKDGTRFTMVVDAVSLSPDRHIGFCRDTTDRKEAEDKLRLAQERYDLAARAAGVGVWDWNPETNEFYVDATVKAILGYDDDEIPNDLDQWISHVHSDDLEPVQRAVREHLDGETPEYVFEHRMLHKDGSVRWILARGRAIRRDDGTVTRMVGTDVDITGRKAAELALHRRESILEAVSFVARRILQVESWEKSVLELLEKLGTAAEVSRVYVFDYQTTGEGRHLFHQRHEWVASGIVPQIDNPEMQAFDPRAEGYGRWEDLLTRGEPVVGKLREFPPAERRLLETQQIRSILVVPIFVGADLWGTVGFDECASERDWTAGEIDALTAAAGILAAAIQREGVDAERVRLERQLRDAHRVESLGALAGGIAHDFNNLLAGILGNASMALQDLSPGSSVRGFVSQIDRSARRAAELVRQLLTYAGKGQMTVSPVCLSSLVREMAELLEVSISRRAVLRMDFASNLPAVEADATELRQVVMNLIINAAEAMDDSTGEVRVRTGCRQCSRADLGEMVLGKALPAGRYVFVEVSDEGSGMSEEVARKIFDPYFSTKFAGRGLGLAAVLGIVRGHRGALEVKSRAGEGTTFRIFFPAGETMADPASRSEEPAPSGWQGHGTVLVVDDDETVLLTASAMLGRMKYEVLTARSGSEGLDQFRRRPAEIDLVLLDMTMPVMDGEETYRQLWKMREDVRVIFSSGYGEGSARELCDSPFCAFLQKPYRQDQLARTIRDLFAAGTDAA